MIYEDSIKLMSKKSLCEQIEELSEGRMYLKDKDKWERQRRNLQDRLYSGKINSKEYSKKSRLLIQNILSNLDTVYISKDENLPF